MESTIPITDWASEQSPLDSAVTYGPEGSIEEYWTKMSATYAEVENGSLDDMGKEFAGDIFDVFRKSEDGEASDESGEDMEENNDEDIGETLLSFAQGMMNDDEEDDEDDDYDDDENYEDDDSGIDMDECVAVTEKTQDLRDESMSGMNLSDMHPKHTPLQGSGVGKNLSANSKPQPSRLSQADMKQLANAYEIEQSDEDNDDESSEDVSEHGGGAAGFLLDSDEDDDGELQDIHKPTRRNQDNKTQQRQSNKAIQPAKRGQQSKQPPRNVQPSHPFLRQESGNDKKNKKIKNKKEIEQKHKMLLLAIVKKKQQEEEELHLAVKKAEAKRKKFKEALLEKAMRSKQMKAEEQEEKDRIEQIERDITAAEKSNKKVAVSRRPKQKPTQTAPPKAQPEVDEAALQAEEDEARAKMEAAVRARKRFVKNQKAILAALRAKKEEKAQQQAEKEEEEQRLREIKRKRNEKFLRMREQKKGEKEDSCENMEANGGVGSALSAVRATRSQEGNSNSLSKTRPTLKNRSTSATHAPKTPDDNCEEGNNLSRAPRRRLKKTRDVKDLTSHANKKQSENIENDKEDEVEDPAVKEKRREEARLRQEKVSLQLALLAEQRKEAAEAVKRKEERAKVRAELLRQRVQLEYSERKLMAVEDMYVNGDIKMRKPKLGAVVPVEEKKPKKKITTEMAEAMVDRMQLKKLKARNQAEGKEGGTEPSASTDVTALLPPARDFLDWKKKHGVPLNGSRVFCMTGWYPCVKDALLERGWVYNPDSGSPHFDLKWTLKSSDTTKGSLQSWQLTNHYLKNVALTTKIGLMKSLQQLNWIADISSDDIFPRGYDLSSPLEIQEYIDDFRHDHVVNILKKLYLRVTGLESPHVAEIPLPSPRPEMNSDKHGNAVLPVDMKEPTISPPPPPIVDNLDEFMVNKAVFNVCVNVLTRYLNPHFAENGIDKEITANSHEISAVEWEIAQSYDMYSATSLPDVCEEPIDDFLRETEREAELSNIQLLPNLEKKKALSELRTRNRKEQYYRDRERLRAGDALEQLIPLGTAGLQNVHTLLSQCKIVSGTQYGLNGNASGAKNMWIVKPAAKSRGRGIMAFNDLRKLLAYVELGKTGKSILTSSQWIVQKYMENPLIIANRKFDFRQWVLVVNWNPLTIYFYDEFYCRFSSEDYDTSDEAMSNTYVHLVNNSVGKNSESFHKAIKAANGEDITEFMWPDAKFVKYCNFMTKSDDTIKKIKNRMKDIAIWSLMCGADSIEHRKNSWELYGFDYMMDDAWNPWLIEINSSPACDYSTKVTERYIKKALVEVLNVTLDVRDWEKLPKGDRPEKPDTGGWECIYAGPAFDTNTTFGAEMCVQGEPMKVPRKRQQPVIRQQELRPCEDSNTDADVVEKRESKSRTMTNTSTPRGKQISNADSSTENPKREKRISFTKPTQSNTSSVERSSPDVMPRPVQSIADMVEQNDTNGLKAQLSPIDFDDSDDDFSVDKYSNDSNIVVEEERSNINKDLDNAQLTAHVKEIVAVPVAVQNLDLTAAHEQNDTRRAVSEKPLLKKEGTVISGKNNVSAIPIKIKTYDPFA